MDGGATKNTWEQVLHRIETKIPAHSFTTWFGPTRFLDEDAASLKVRVPNDWFAEWLKTNYLDVIHDALREVDRPGLTIDFETEVVDPPVARPVPRPPTAQSPHARAPRRSRLRRRRSS